MGRMKSMGYDYALYLADRGGDDPSRLFEQIVNGSIEVPSWFVTKWVEENPVFAAETKAWKQQKRDTKGRFSTGFITKTDAQLEVDYQEKIEFDESYGEHLEEQALYEDVIAPYYQYVDMDVDLEVGPDEITDFMETAIGDDEFPEKLTEPAFFQFLQKIAESVPLEILEGLNSIMNLQQQLGDKMGDRDTEITGGRGVFITEILMNIKTGQEAWAAEESMGNIAVLPPSVGLGKTSCCCGATVRNPCVCMIEGIMDCSSTEPMCPCYQKLAGAEGTWYITNDAEGEPEPYEKIWDDYPEPLEDWEIDALQRDLPPREDAIDEGTYEWIQENTNEDAFDRIMFIINFWFSKYQKCKDGEQGQFGAEELIWPCNICGKTFDSFREINEHMNAQHIPSQRNRAEDDKKPVGTPMELGKALDWMPYDEKITAFSRKRAENDDDSDSEVNLMRFELVEAEMEAVDFNYLYDLLLHGTPGWANIPDEEVIEEYRQRFER